MWRIFPRIQDKIGSRQMTLKEYKLVKVSQNKGRVGQKWKKSIWQVWFEKEYSEKLQ